MILLFIIFVASFLMVQAPPGNALTAEIQQLQSRGGTVPQEQITGL